MLNIRMRWYEIIDEDGTTDAIKPVSPSLKPRQDRYQTTPAKRTRRQDGTTSRWQEPPTPAKVKAVSPVKPVAPAEPAA